MHKSQTNSSNTGKHMCLKQSKLYKAEVYTVCEFTLTNQQFREAQGKLHT